MLYKLKPNIYKNDEHSRPREDYFIIYRRSESRERTAYFNTFKEMIINQYGWIMECEVDNCRKLDYNSRQKAGPKGFNAILRSLEVSDKPLEVSVCLFVSVENFIILFFNF